MIKSLHVHVYMYIATAIIKLIVCSQEGTYAHSTFNLDLMLLKFSHVALPNIYLPLLVKTMPWWYQQYCQY